MTALDNGTRATLAKALGDADLVAMRATIRDEINRRLPLRRGERRRLELIDRTRSVEINLAEVESCSLLEALDAVALELRTRGEAFGPLMVEFANASDDALVASMRDLSDDQIAMLVEQAAAIERIAGVALAVQLEREGPA